MCPSTRGQLKPRDSSNGYPRWVRGHSTDGLLLLPAVAVVLELALPLPVAWRLKVPGLVADQPIRAQ